MKPETQVANQPQQYNLQISISNLHWIENIAKKTNKWYFNWSRSMATRIWKTSLNEKWESEGKAIYIHLVYINNTNNVHEQYVHIWIQRLRQAQLSNARRQKVNSLSIPTKAAVSWGSPYTDCMSRGVLVHYGFHIPSPITFPQRLSKLCVCFEHY